MSARHRPLAPALRGLFALLLLAALAPFLAGELPLAARLSGTWRFPVARCLSGEDRFWIALAALLLAAAAVRARGGARVAGGTAALLFAALALGGGGRPLPSELDWRAARGAEGAFVLPTPAGFGPNEADPEAIAAALLPAPPSRRHWLGTDGSARDLLARLIHGTRVSLGIAVCATAVAVGIGLLLGLLCGAFGGAVDVAVSRLIEVFLCFPQLFLVLVVFAYLPHSRLTLTLLLGVVGWTTTARIARGELLRLSGEEFVVAARALGVSRWRLALRHLLPNAVGPIAVAATFGVAGALLAEFGLSFLGFGVEPPTPSLGQMLAEGKSVLALTPWIAILPGTMILLVVLSFNAMGEALRRRIAGTAAARAGDRAA